MISWWASWAVLAVLVTWLLVAGGPAALVAVLAWTGGWISSDLARHHRRR